ncbi:MAG: radical SAM protein [Candidatus Omnitrophota bacterium]
MNILYVVHSFSVVEPCGVLLLSAITKARGHKSFIAAIDAGDIEQKIVNNDIDVVAYSFMSTEASFFLQLSHVLRKSFPNLIIVAGGPHPTYYPQIIDSWPIDAVIVGEGDLVINELIENLRSKKDISHLQNIHTKQFKNPQGFLVEDMDSLPYADRELLRDVAPFKYVKMKSFFATRGCPFNCSYCFNSAYNEMHKGKGKILRRRSVENLIGEIELVKKNFDIDFVRFGDDAFITSHDDWVDEFVEKYALRVKLPFYLLINPNIVSKDLVVALKKAGCHSVMMGIESGSEDLRKGILNRYIGNDVMLKAFALFREQHIKIFSNTILGLPDSTLQDDLQSVAFTLECRPTYSGFSVFTPFPGTNLYKYSKERGYLSLDESFNDEFPQSMQQDSVLNHITDRQKKIHRNILLLVPIANWLPFLRKLIVNHLIYWEPNAVFSFFGFLVRNYLNMKIWPFGKSPYTFFAILKSVMRIDKKNYALRGNAIRPKKAFVARA